MNNDNAQLDLPILLNRCNYALLGLIGDLLAESELAGVVQPSMGQVLFALFREDGCSISELSVRCGLAASTLTGLVKKIELAGLVERKRDESDRRSTLLYLTKKGRSIEPALNRFHKRLMQQLSARMNKQELLQSQILLARILEVLQAR